MSDPVDPRPIWIDLDNAPHVVFFAPIVRELEARGRRVLLTARAVNNTPELAARFGLAPVVTGRPFGRALLSKVLGTVRHSIHLTGLVRGSKPLLAASHGSRAQALTARLLRIPLVLFFDYEGADLRVFRGVARRVYFPDALSDAARAWPGPTDLRRPYPGLKEHLALLGRGNDREALRSAGIPIDEPYAVIRPESDTAHYLDGIDDGLLLAAIRKCGSWGLVPVVVPRSSTQSKRLAPILAGAGRFVMPSAAVNGIDLLAEARLLVSGGGTMNREAVVLGMPCISIFRGVLGSLDRSFIGDGRMLHVASPSAMDALVAQPTGRMVDGLPTAKRALQWIVDGLESDADKLGGLRPSPPD
jgi:predicted glycosyltransferase